MPIDTDKLKRGPPPFQVRKIGHVVLRVRDLQKSVDFYTGVLGFKVSDVYPEDMMPGGMVFMRFGGDHHGVALVGGMKEASTGSEHWRSRSSPRCSLRRTRAKRESKSGPLPAARRAVSA